MRLPSVGLLGRIILILGFVLATEFIVNTVISDRVSRFALRDDEAHRMAEYLVVARRVLDRTSPAGRVAAASELSTPRIKVDWRQGIDTRPTQFDLNDLRAQMLAFEPKLLEGKLRLHLMPLRQGGDIAGSVELTDHTTMTFHASQPHAFWQLTAGRALGLGLPMLALAILGALMIRATLRPLRQLMKATSSIGAHEPTPVEEEGPSEMRALIRDFNAMQKRIHRMVTTRTQALMAVGHDLRTPLARLELRLEDAPIDPVERSAMLDDINEMGDLIKSLQIYMAGEGEQVPAERLDLAVMAATIVDTASDGGHDAIYDGPGSLEIWGRPVSIRRALTNLVENALHYGGNARVSIRQTDDATLICVDDDGPGIPPDKIDTVVHPFTRLSEGRARNTKGMGLGLAIVVNAVRAEGARLSLENRPEGGLRATIRLPRPQG